MGTDVDVEEQIMIGKNYREAKQIDPQRERFPCCIVYTPLPLLSWLIPFIGHVGICREDGVILDFAGPNFVSVDNFAFGSVTRYLQIDEKLCRVICMRDREPQNSSGYEVEISRWDDAIRLSTQEYQHRSYSLLTCNCHSFVANNLNRLDFRGHHWNVVSVAILMLFKAQWVNRAAILKTFLPFIIVFSLCVALGGSTFLKFWAMFLFLLVGWFILGSYCVTSLIEL